MILSVQIALVVVYVVTLLVSLVLGLRDLHVRVQRRLRPSRFMRFEQRTMRKLRYTENSPLPRHWSDTHMMLDSLSDRGEAWLVTTAAFLAVVGGAVSTSIVGTLLPDAPEVWIASGTIATIAFFLALYVLLTFLRRRTEPIGTVSVMGRRLIMSAVRFEATDTMANHHRFAATSRILLAYARRLGMDTSNSSLRSISLSVEDGVRDPRTAQISIHHVQELLAQLHSGAYAGTIAKARTPGAWLAGDIDWRTAIRRFGVVAPAVAALFGLFIR